jgi:FkbM family methyltransferase
MVKQPHHLKKYNRITPMYYSQFQEDLFLNQHIFKNKKFGIYIELGALDGVTFSNTKFFEDTLKWKGILIEPHPIQFKVLQQTRPNNILVNHLVSCHKEPLLFRYFEESYSAVSGVENTLIPFHVDLFFENQQTQHLHQDKIWITPKSLTEIVRETRLTHIDLLSLDVEGHEYEVLQSWDFSVPIDVIMIETIPSNPERNELCRQLLLKNGYRFFSTCSDNEIFVSDKIETILSP